MSRREFALWLVVIVSMVAIASCGGAQKPTAGPIVQPQPCPDERPVPSICDIEMDIASLRPLDFTEPQQDTKGEFWLSTAIFTNTQNYSFSVAVTGASEQFTREYLGWLYLFRIDDSERWLTDLNSGNLPENLLNLQTLWNFSAPREYLLSEAITVSVQEKGTKWQIVDQKAQKEYLVTKSNGPLDIYLRDQPVRVCFDLLLIKDCVVDAPPEIELPTGPPKGNDVVIWIQPIIAKDYKGAAFFDYVIDPKIKNNGNHYYSTNAKFKNAYVSIAVRKKRGGSGAVGIALCGDSRTPIAYKEVDQDGTDTYEISHKGNHATQYAAGVQSLKPVSYYRISKKSGSAGWFAEYGATKGWGTQPTCNIPTPIP